MKMQNWQSSSPFQKVVGWVIAGLAGLLPLTISPLLRHERELTVRLAELRERTAGMRQAIQEIKQQEQAAANVRSELRQLEGDLPTGAALAWFPSRMQQHFNRLGVHGSVTRLNTSRAEPEAPDYERTFWAVALPAPRTSRDVSNLLLAVADLEHTEPFVKVIDLAITQGNEADDPAAIINITALTRR